MSPALVIGVKGESRAVLGLAGADTFLLPYLSHVGSGVVLGVVVGGSPRCGAGLVVTFLLPCRSQMGRGLVAGLVAIGAVASCL